MKLPKLKCTAIFVAGIFATSISAIARADWSITGLGALGGTYSVARAINDSGQVVGNGNGSDHAFITGANGVGMNYLDTLGGTGSYASGINNSPNQCGDTVNGSSNT